MNPSFYELATICDNDMVYDVDYSWNISRTTLAIEFDLICKNNELSLLTSLYFVGAMFGLFIGKIFENVMLIIAPITCMHGSSTKTYF